MQEKIDLQLLWKRFAGNNLKLFFGPKDIKSAKMVLILSNVIAFTEYYEKEADNYVLEVREGGTVYGLDMSLRLKKPEYANFPETLLFIECPGPDIAFRAVSEKVLWSDIDAMPDDHENY